MKIEIPESFWKRLNRIIHREIEEPGKPYISSLYDIITIPLETARQSVEIEEITKGDSLYVKDLVGVVFVQFNRDDAPLIELAKEDKINFSFERIYLTNEAQTGSVELIISRGGFDITRLKPAVMQPVDVEAQYTALLVSTSVVLEAAESYTSDWKGLGNYGSIIALACADVAGTIYLQWSNDGVNIHDEEAQALSSLVLVDTSTIYRINLQRAKSANNIRIHFVNGATDQTSFSLMVYAKVI